MTIRKLVSAVTIPPLLLATVGVIYLVAAVPGLLAALIGAVATAWATRALACRDPD